MYMWCNQLLSTPTWNAERRLCGFALLFSIFGLFESEKKDSKNRKENKEKWEKLIHKCNTKQIVFEEHNEPGACSFINWSGFIINGADRN